MSQDIETKVVDVIAEELGMKRSKVMPASRIEEDLGVASLDYVDLWVALESASSALSVRMKRKV